MSAILQTPPLPALRFALLEQTHLAVVAHIERTVYAFPWTLGNFCDSLAAGYTCWGAWLDDGRREPIAYAIVMLALDEAHLLNLAVAAPWQGRGVGSALLSHVIEDARQQRCEMLYLEVRPSNVNGLRLYERFGFRHLGIRRGYYPAVTGREDALFLGLNIASSLL